MLSRRRPADGLDPPHLHRRLRRRGLRRREPAVLSAARLQTLLGLEDEELLQILGCDPIAVITGEEDLRPEIRILLQLLEDDPPPRGVDARRLAEPAATALAAGLRRLRGRARRLSRARLRDPPASVVRVRTLLARPHTREIAPADRAVAVDDHPRDLEDHALERRGAEDLDPRGDCSVVPFGGSSSSIFVHAKLNSRLPTQAGDDAEDDPDRLVDELPRRPTIPVPTDCPIGGGVFRP